MPVLTINQKFRAVTVAQATAEPSEAVLKTAEMFGIGLDESYEVTLFEGLLVDVRPGDVVYVTGPSGSGKSVLLTRMAEALREAWPDARFADLAAMDLAAGRAVIDLLQPPLEQALKVLSAAGLADAFLLLRTPEELSDGQRWRLRLAMAIQECRVMSAECRVEEERDAGTEGRRDGEKVGRIDTGRGAEGTAAPSSLRPSVPASPPFSTLHSSFCTPHCLLVADEFCSTLDRLCARAVAYRVRRMASREGVTVLAASAHDDLLEDLAPDVLVVKHEGVRVEVFYADPSREEARP